MNWKTIGIIALVIAASGCTSTTDTGGDTGSFKLLVSDRPSVIDQFEYLNVTFSQARIFKSSINATNSSVNTTNSSDFTTINLDDRPTVDLKAVQGPKVKEILSTNLSTGNYSKIELQVSKVEGTVNGSLVDVKVPSNKLMITKDFVIEPNKTTTFVFDIMVVKKGNQGYNLQPVISESGPVDDIEPAEPDSGNSGTGKRPSSPGSQANRP